MNNEDSTEEGFFSVISQVKPRTNEKDPITKKPFYLAWIILTTHEEASRIYSAYCGCKGGLDGSCRHVVATLFEIVNYINDFAKASVTSGPCLWVRRAATNLEPVLITDLETRHVASDIHQPVYPTEDVYDPMPRNNVVPSVDSFMEAVKQYCPSACILDSVIIKDTTDESCYEMLHLPTPMDYTSVFFNEHKCDTSLHASNTI